MNPPKKKEFKTARLVKKKSGLCEIVTWFELESTERCFEEIIGGIDSLDDMSMS